MASKRAGRVLIALGALCIRAVLAQAGNPAVPLDDAFIHMQYARRLADGGFFSFVAGEGYSTGATSFLWPVLLATVHGFKTVEPRLIEVQQRGRDHRAFQRNLELGAIRLLLDRAAVVLDRGIPVSGARRAYTRRTGTHSFLLTTEN